MPQEKRLFSSDSEGEEEYKPTKKQAGSSKKVVSSEDESDMSDDMSSEGESRRASKKQTPKKTAVKNTTEKKTVAADVERNAEGDQIFPLSAKRRVTVRSFPNGGAAIDIREVYTDKNGEQRPGKGICLPLDQWKKLNAFLPDIEEAIAALPNKK